MNGGLFRRIQIGEEFGEILNALDFRMAEGLIVGPVRHENKRFGILSGIPTVFVPIIDENLDPQFTDQRGFVILREINHRPSDAMFLQPVSGDAADVVGLTLIAVGDENEPLLGAERIECSPMFRGGKGFEPLPECRVVRNL